MIRHTEQPRPQDYSELQSCDPLRAAEALHLLEPRPRWKSFHSDLKQKVLKVLASRRKSWNCQLRWDGELHGPGGVVVMAGLSFEKGWEGDWIKPKLVHDLGQSLPPHQVETPLR